ncbi:hypothetical protein J1N35_022921 [Gossypium stocksii]|uniref:UBN2 domain-containing protein n=1 Tax=Gossypium stocksii TaxID=47602 RepID=A0A9D3VHC7_9ROSI|nr:hypothetical protein J1N35_022921 [Gossypium stocksii]
MLALDKLINSLLTHKMRLNKGVKKAKIEKKTFGVALKSTTNEDSEPSEEVDEDKEMTMFVRRFNKFMRSNRGRKFQKKKGLKLKSLRRRIP